MAGRFYRGLTAARVRVRSYTNECQRVQTLMSSQMQTMSVRVPSEDVEWLSSLEIAGAVTPSDKLRGLIAQMRRQHQGTMDYAACVAWLRDLLGPFVTALREVEHRHKLHSDAVN